MRNSTAGFTLIELVVALTIASILSLMIFGFVNQTARVNAHVASTVDYGLEMSIVYAQLERDLMAIMVSESSFASYKRSLKKGAQDKKEEVVDAQSEKKTEKRTREIAPPFFVQVHDERLELLYFTTTNRLKRHKVFAPYNSRVVYRLIADEGLPGYFKLVRSEAHSLTRPINDFLNGDVSGHVLLSRIKSLSIKLFVPEDQKSESKKEGSDKNIPAATEKSAAQEKFSYKELTSWNPSELKKATYMVPAYVEISGVRADIDGKRMRPFTIACKIPIFQWQQNRIKKIVAISQRLSTTKVAPQKISPSGKKDTLTVGGRKRPGLANLQKKRGGR